MTYDVIIIGGGHNGLTAAASLAKLGRTVLVIEQRDQVGGLASSIEFHPGYRTGGTLHDSSSVRSSILDRLGLRDHGLTYRDGRPPVTLLSDDGRSVTLSGDADRSAESIGKISVSDAEAYRQYCLFIRKITPVLRKVLDNHPPDLKTLGFSDLKTIASAGVGIRRLGKDEMLELLKVIPMSIADFLNERFETDFIKAGIGFPGIFSSFAGPWSSYTTLNLLLWEASAGTDIEGGASSLAGSLQRAAEASGVEIRTGEAVAEISLGEDGEATGVVLANGTTIRAGAIASSIHPRTLFHDLLPAATLDSELDTEISHYRSRGTVASLTLALSRPIEWKCQPEAPISFARTGSDLDTMEKAFDAVKYRTFSSNPVLDIHVVSATDSSLAPDGGEVVSVLSHFAPFQPDSGWSDTLRDELKESILTSLGNQTHNLRDAIVGEELLTPADLEVRFGLSGGHLLHGEHAVDQIIGRPVPSCATYTTPVERLFLCGAGSHPGGGLTCVPGSLAADVIHRSIR